MTRNASRQLDKVLAAHIAVNLAPGLSGNAKAVAGAILAHWNRRTGQCDPSIERLAAMLGVNRATVLRATAELCTGDARLFDKKSHGGKAHRAAYAPRWEALRAIVVDWNARMLTGGAPDKVAKVRRSPSQDCDVEGRKTATQTYRRNLSKEPVAVEAPAPKRRRRTRQEVGQGWLMLPIPGGQPSHADAARNAAERRIMSDLRSRGTDVYGGVCLVADDAMLSDAIDAELGERGTGAPSLMVAVARRAAS